MSSSDNDSAREIEVEGPAAEKDPADAAEESADGGVEQRIAELEQAAAEAREAALRAQAELENFRRRSARDMEKTRKYALERFAQDLLEVRDSVERGLELAHAGGATVEQLAEGGELTFRLLDKALSAHGIEVIDPVGEPFDPERHEAMSMAPTDEQAPDTVLNVIQKGFVLNDRLLRPARVIVARPAA